MGFLGRLIDRIDAKVDRPADQSLLDADRNPGSEKMISSDTPTETAETVRRDRRRRRHRWRFTRR